VDQIGAVAGQQLRRVRSDHPPVTDGEDTGASVAVSEMKMIDQTNDMLDSTRILDIEKHDAPHLWFHDRRPIGEQWKRGRRR
jgi:hypothetical protein